MVPRRGGSGEVGGLYLLSQIPAEGPAQSGLALRRRGEVAGLPMLVVVRIIILFSSPTRARLGGGDARAQKGTEGSAEEDRRCPTIALERGGSVGGGRSARVRRSLVVENNRPSSLSRSLALASGLASAQGSAGRVAAAAAPPLFPGLPRARSHEWPSEGSGRPAARRAPARPVVDSREDR